MRMIATLALAAAFSALAAAPAASCITMPQEKWGAIQAALPKANLTDADIAKIEQVKALHAIAFAAVAAKNYHEAEEATAKAAHIVGLVWVPRRPPMRSCGGTYRLKSELDAH
jgi:hypothetical protein